MSYVFLYTTAGCHLCELAKEILWPILPDYEYALRLQEIDIAESDELIAGYGIRIPVLVSASGAEDIGWPFDEKQVRDFFERAVLRRDQIIPE